ncbi:MAG: hypothetical protein WCV80_00035 [Candidatus Paceibacterota bacterium]|jgi:hypothetical protein
MEQKSLTTVAVVGLITLVIGYLVGMSQGVSKGESTIKASYASKIEEVKKLFPSTPEIYSVFGMVKSLDGKVITVETQVFGNPFEEIPKVREITVGTDTKITKNEQISAEEYKKLIEEYQVAMKKFQKDQQTSMALGRPAPLPVGGYPMLPSMTKEVIISVSDIKVGDSITVRADKNIKTEAKFEASSVSVSLASPTSGVTPAAVPPPVTTPATP